MRLAIFDLDNWREIITTLSRNKTRTFMTAFGVFWGTAILTICWGGSHGFQGMMNRNFEGISTNMGGLYSGYTTKPYGGFNKGRSWDLTDADIADFNRLIPDIDQWSTMEQIRANASYNQNAYNATVSGVRPDYFDIQRSKLLEGRLLNESDNTAQRKVAVVGYTVATQLFGTESPVGKFIDVGGFRYKVVGLVQQLSQASIGGDVDASVYVPSSTLRTAYNISNPSFYVFTSKSGVRTSEVLSKMRSILKRNHYIAPDDDEAIYSLDISEMFEMVQKVYTAIDIVALFVGLGTLLAGVVGVGNIMWIIVKERTGEFGIRRAIGATPLDITVQILSESIVLTTIAGLTGVSLAALILGMMDNFQYDPWLGAPGFQISFTSAIVILVLFLLFGTLAGLIPALKAMKIKPVEAMASK